MVSKSWSQIDAIGKDIVRKFDHVMGGGQLWPPDDEEQGAAAAEQHDADVHEAVGQGPVLLSNHGNFHIWK